MRVLIRDDRIIDRLPSPARGGEMLGENERISQNHDALEQSASDMVIDGKGGTPMPGMTEADAQLTPGSSIEQIYHQVIQPPEEFEVTANCNALVLFDQSFTRAYFNQGAGRRCRSATGQGYRSRRNTWSVSDPLGTRTQPGMGRGRRFGKAGDLGRGRAEPKFGARHPICRCGNAGGGRGGQLMGLDIGQVREAYFSDLLLVDNEPTAAVSDLQDKNRLATIMKGALYKVPAETTAA